MPKFMCVVFYVISENTTATRYLYVKPNTTLCLEYPEISVVVWNKICTCPVPFIGIYPCGSCKSSITKPFRLSENSSQICFADKSSSLNEMVIHFIVSQYPCGELECSITVTTLLSSYKVYIAGKL